MNEIFTRRSVRQFADKPVEQAKVEQLLRAAMQAPSAGNQQPWRFLVVRGKEELTALATCNPYARFLPTADLAVIVLCDNRHMVFAEYWQQDLAAATQNLLLEATHLGLGTVWMGTAPDVERMAFVKERYQLAEYLTPFSMIAVGYPKDAEAHHFADRYDAEKVTYIG